MSSDTVTAEQCVADSRFARVIRRWLRSRFDAEDVAQSVAEKILARDLEPKSSYVTSMLRNASIDVHRAKQVRESNEDAFARLIEGNTASSAEEAVHWTQAVDTFEATLNQLNPITREIFVRCALDDEPRLEVAKSLGLHVSTVEKRLAKARRSCFEAIREFLEP